MVRRDRAASWFKTSDGDIGYFETTGDEVQRLRQRARDTGQTLDAIIREYMAEVEDAERREQQEVDRCSWWVRLRYWLTSRMTVC